MALEIAASEMSFVLDVADERLDGGSRGVRAENTLGAARLRGTRRQSGPFLSCSTGWQLKRPRSLTNQRLEVENPPSVWLGSERGHPFCEGKPTAKEVISDVR